MSFNMSCIILMIRKVLKCHIFLYIFSRRQIFFDIYRFISKDNGFDISCKLHEIPKSIFQEKKNNI